MHMSGTIAPLARSSSPGGMHRPSSMPRDFHKIVGTRLPFSLYFLMSQGVLSRKLPSVLAQQGEWLDYTHPCVDSIEYRELLIDVREYRCRALALIAMRLHEAYRSRPIKFSRYSCSSSPHASHHPPHSHSFLPAGGSACNSSSSSSPLGPAGRLGVIDEDQHPNSTSSNTSGAGPVLSSSSSPLLPLHSSPPTSSLHSAAPPTAPPTMANSSSSTSSSSSGNPDNSSTHHLSQQQHLPSHVAHNDGFHLPPQNNSSSNSTGSTTSPTGHPTASTAASLVAGGGEGGETSLTAGYNMSSNSSSEGRGGGGDLGGMMTGGESDYDALVPLKIDTSIARVWRIDAEKVHREMKRQNTNKIDVKFCLRWHSHAQDVGETLFDPPPSPQNSQDLHKFLSSSSSSPAGSSPSSSSSSQQQDGKSLLALTHFMLLDNLSYFTVDGETTVFGCVLMNAPDNLQEDILFTLELLKFGLLTGDPLEAPADRPYPPGVQLLRRVDTPVDKRRSILLLSRVFSLYPMKLIAGYHWEGDIIDFDLAGYSCLVKLLKRSLRHLTEACLANILMKDITKVR
ncbi:xpg n-terminal domain-containing protein [Cystoisospora suis]|uniref:Xpg n-terminal domain-containing protein n=1 Tax=Cystoisospora suis TaxID=483139 RepID=A0A2C6KMS0_9APIC|nr:xpg n-terminal domain-containing protein [Cystoisospora suis]